MDCRLVVVLGHDSCGAVAAARAAVAGEPPTPGYVRDIVERVTPSDLAAQAAGLHNDSDMIDTHIRHTVDLLLDRSLGLAEQVTQNHVGVVGLVYHLAEGKARLVISHAIPAATAADTPTDTAN
ncbi:carbonic anhydrase [Streptomyces sp. NPDC048643]|uniref:carbonic anhydrase n=1 Tax=Streptomyces sp. NPDC048643 TaxID=3155637 RepID=UPI003420E17D